MSSWLNILSIEAIRLAGPTSAPAASEIDANLTVFNSPEEDFLAVRRGFSR